MLILECNNSVEKLLTDDTTGIAFEDMFPISLNEDYCKKINIDISRKKHWDNWYIYKSEFYYLKARKKTLPIVKELIGEDLSKYMSLPTVEYSLCLQNGKIIGLVSKNFRKQDRIYFSGTQSGVKLHTKRECALRYKDAYGEKYSRELVSYMIKNFFVNQKDRQVNTLYYIKDGEDHLAELFDYEASFKSSNESILEDPLFSYYIKEERIKEYAKTNPLFEEYIELVLSYNIEDALSRIESGYGIGIHEEIKSDIIQYTKSRRENFDIFKK